MKTLLVITQTLLVFINCMLGLSQECHKKYTGPVELPQSCKEILSDYPATPSGYYHIQPPGAVTVEVYCDMENERCGSKGWTRVAYVDVLTNKSCPGDLTFYLSPTPTCRGPTTTGCASANFSTYGISYTQVCGRLRGYQVGHPDAFGPYINTQNRPDLIIDGVLISHGEMQAHVWAYALGRQKVPLTSADESRVCPCSGPRFTGVVPPFIGNDYYCDSAVDQVPVAGTFYSTPMWTGKGCTPPNYCCSQSGMPWFCKTLPVPTTDYIELRNCYNGPSGAEDTALDLIELYVR